MKIMNVFILILLASIPVFPQSADSIVNKNLFDPQRGQAEPADDTSGPVEDVLPKDIPILDGIVTIGSYQRVIFRYRDEKSHKIVSGIFKKGDKCTSAKILQVLPNEVTIAFAGKKYKLTVDSKDKMKNIPKTSGFHKGGINRTVVTRASKSRIVERKITPARRAPAVRTPPRQPGSVSRRSAASTPFGSSRGSSRTRKRPKNTRNTTPF